MTSETVWSINAIHNSKVTYKTWNLKRGSILHYPSTDQSVVLLNYSRWQFLFQFYLKMDPGGVVSWVLALFQEYLSSAFHERHEGTIMVMIGDKSFWPNGRMPIKLHQGHHSYWDHSGGYRMSVTTSCSTRQ